MELRVFEFKFKEVTDWVAAFGLISAIKTHAFHYQMEINDYEHNLEVREITDSEKWDEIIIVDNENEGKEKTLREWLNDSGSEPHVIASTGY